MGEQSAERDAPTCRTCYAQTLSKYERVRFWDAPITGPVHYCSEHQAVQVDLMSRVDWSKVVVRTPPGSTENPIFVPVDDFVQRVIDRRTPPASQRGDS